MNFISNITFSKFSVKILKFIAYDIINNKNLITDLNKSFNDNKYIYYHKIKQLYISMYEILYNIVINLDLNPPLNHLIKIYTWKSIKHQYPINYVHYLKLKPKIKYSTYKELYNKNMIDHKYHNYETYINHYTSDLNSEINILLNNFQNNHFIDLDTKLYFENKINMCKY
jgi:hypothetical protein